MSADVGRRRRILYIDLAPGVGGSVISLYQVLKGLDRSRYEPHVILHAANRYAERLRALDIPVLTVSGGAAAGVAAPAAWDGLRAGRLAAWLRRGALRARALHLVGFYLRQWPALRRTAAELAGLMRRVRPDLVHLNDVVCVSRAAIMAARRVGAPAICHLRAMDRRNHYDRWLSRYLRGYICISRAVDCHQRTLGGRVAPSWVVYNGLDVDAFVQDCDRVAARAEFGCGDDDLVVGCVGRLVAWKGQEVFLRAVAQVAPHYPRLCALLVGAPETGEPEAGGDAYAQHLRALAAELGLAERVVFTGFRSDVARLLSGMDVMVHASTAPEPFGRVLIEAMAAGAAVIGTRAGAVPEIVIDG
ncbi:MAG: glycosyltransferase, partial [Chloroflexota bacterium]